MNEKTMFEISVGLVFLIAMTILGYYTIVMTKGVLKSDKIYYMTVIFPNIEGLDVANKVKVNGVISGSVDEIQLIGYEVLVKLKMYNSFTLYENYSIKIKGESALGIRIVSIYPGVPIDKDGNKYAILETRTGLRGHLEDPLSSLSQIIEENRENIYASLKNIREISDKINSGKGTIGKLINNDKMHSDTDQLVKELRETIEDVREQAPVTSFIRAALTAF